MFYLFFIVVRKVIIRMEGKYVTVIRYRVLKLDCLGLDFGFIFIIKLVLNKLFEFFEI